MLAGGAFATAAESVRETPTKHTPLPDSDVSGPGHSVHCTPTITRRRSGPRANTMRSRSHYTVRGMLLVAAVLSVWLLSSEPWGLGVAQLIVFTGPGALLGLGAGWMAHASARSRWSWRSARTAALLGAGTLPPVLAFLIALEGNARPQQLLVGFVYAAWIALGGGAVVALARGGRAGFHGRLKGAATASTRLARRAVPTRVAARSSTASSPSQSGDHRRRPNPSARRSVDRARPGSTRY